MGEEPQPRFSASGSSVRMREVSVAEKHRGCGGCCGVEASVKEAEEPECALLWVHTDLMSNENPKNGKNFENPFL